MMAMVTVIAGRETTFKPLLDAALRRGLERAGLDPRLAAGALEKLPDMPAYPDVPDALAALRAGGFQLARADAVGGRRGRGRAGQRGHARLRSSSCSRRPSSGAFKPEDLAYRYALERAGATDAWFVAGHWWDVAGAAYAGLRTAWICRTDLAYPDAMPAPDVRGADLAAVARRSSIRPKGVRPLHARLCLRRARAASATSSSSQSGSGAWWRRTAA